MIASTSGVALRFFRAQKLLTASSILTVALSIALVLTMANLFANTQTSIAQIRAEQDRVAFHDPVRAGQLAAEFEHAQRNLEPLRTFIVALSALTLLTSGLLAISNFDILHKKNQKQYAAMRSIGATAQQLARIGAIQSGVITAVGTSLGLLLTLAVFGSSRLWFEQAFSFSSIYGISSFDLNIGLLLQVLVLCIIFIQAILLYPVLRMGLSLPLEAQVQTKTHYADRPPTGGRKAAILVLLLAGLSFISLSLLDNVLTADHATVAGAVVIPDNSFTVLVGTPLLIAALFMLLPFVMPRVLEALIPLLRKAIGTTSFLAVKNLVPQIRKSALMILLVSAVIMSAVFGTTFLETVRRGEHTNLKEYFPTEFVLSRTASDDSSIDSEQLRADLLSDPAVQYASIVRQNLFPGFDSARTEILHVVQGHDHLTDDFLIADLAEMQAQGLLEEFASDFKLVHNDLVISWKMASLYDLRPGDTLTIRVSDLAAPVSDDYPEDQEPAIDEQDFTIAEILRDFPGYGPNFWLVANSADPFFDTHTDLTSVKAVYVSGSDEGGILGHLNQVLAHYPDLSLGSYSAAVAASDQTFFQMWSLVIVVTGVLLLCSVVGVFNTLVAHINQKRKEYAVLRALAISQGGIVQVILTQVMLYVVTGLAFGLVLGVLMTYLMIIIDPTQVYFNLVVLAAITVTMLATTLVVFVFIARKISRVSASIELTLSQ
ncbi:MAG: hypothetical protein FWE46_00430 [Coriobacteriia bacterium]|nr:hypothetical protein [Coriobacteriia bacterium]MCL2536758.1 hypothetical protein [Coriobacteriia bacterium]